eukprot:CAMPEP_0194445716 /NCGR_PEP_ID=MMETSP0176-20130528/128022_1 /TAXON_ID=216777 /ORGANISM="Proboscia alata, Strain PI-D3" /LENGTH=419 /DNA_ID=CAMNT_0039272319 /DNA_START=253 /DNA_END=1509 /DNA_ORIENTATION=+
MPSVAESIVADVLYPSDTIKRIAFGSCHNSELIMPGDDIVWDAIRKSEPDSFLWTGDAIYPSVKGDAPVSVLRRKFTNTLTNSSIGYAQFVSFSPILGIHGTWDDHDYGGNDRGSEMTEKNERRSAFLSFLGRSNKIDSYVFNRSSKGRVTKPDVGRNGLYYSVTYGEAPRKTTVYFLDTRTFRSRHCIPSLAAVKFVPLGSVISCVTRLLSAGLKLPFCSWRKRKYGMLGEEQWEWFENTMMNDHVDSSLHIVVSSVQVLTTNPVVESWGHFDMERSRLIKLLSGVNNRVVLLSGDVHFAEISRALRQGIHVEGTIPTYDIVEVTSSGMTHSCESPFYGFLCKPILFAFSDHRQKHKLNGSEEGNEAFFTNRNFGVIDIDWGANQNAEDASVTINVHDVNGNVVLSTGSLPLIWDKAW